jgi:hypothetical protein
MNDYPWYAVVRGESLEQGDILRQCPVFLPPKGLSARGSRPEGLTVEFEWTERDVIVLSQTCDLAQGREKVAEVLLCAVWSCDEVGGHLATPKGKEDARRGNLPPYHMLAPCRLPGFEGDVSVVDFRRVYSLPLDYFRELAAGVGDRIRLLPPYREHLAQAFARFFMRVGLPVDIPSFSPQKTGGPT